MKALEQLDISPAPWTFAHDEGHSIVASVDGSTFILYSFKDENGIAKANARLIAAAPELYEALRKIMETFRDEFDPDCLSTIETSVLNMADAALEKAGGAE